MHTSIKNRPTKWWFGVIAISALFVFISIYTYSRMNTVINGVKVVAKVEKSNNSQMVNIKGNAKNATYISLNGREIFIDTKGNFSEPIALSEGLGTIRIEAQDKFGHTSIKEFGLVHKNTDHIALSETLVTSN